MSFRFRVLKSQNQLDTLLKHFFELVEVTSFDWLVGMESFRCISSLRRALCVFFFLLFRASSRERRNITRFNISHASSSWPNHILGSTTRFSCDKFQESDSEIFLDVQSRVSAIITRLRSDKEFNLTKLKLVSYYGIFAVERHRHHCRR